MLQVVDGVRQDTGGFLAVFLCRHEHFNSRALADILYQAYGLFAGLWLIIAVEIVHFLGVDSLLVFFHHLSSGRWPEGDARDGNLFFGLTEFRGLIRNILFLV